MEQASIQHRDSPDDCGAEDYPHPLIVAQNDIAILPELVVSKEQIEAVESKMLHLPQVDCPLTHRFAPGVYLREILMPAGTIVIGHEHKTCHFNIVLQGRALVMINGKPFQVEAPYTFISEPGVRKVLYILEDMRWATVHPTHETDLQKLEDELIVKSESFLQYHDDIERLKELANIHD